MKKAPKIFQKINTRIPLPSLPQTLCQMVRICRDPQCPAEKIVQTATTDPALTLKFLQVAGQLRPQPLSYDSIFFAAETLGPRQLKNLAAARLMSLRSNPLLQESRFHFQSFWLQSVCCAVLSANLVKEIRPQFYQDAYLAGLLHNCGALLLWSIFGKKYESIRDISRGDPDSMQQSEIETFGTDQVAVGRDFLQKLNVHPFITEAVFHQQRNPREIAYALPLTQAVNTAVRVCRGAEFGNLTARVADTDLPFDGWTLQEAAAKTDLQMERMLHEMQTSSQELLEEEKSRRRLFLPADVMEEFHASVSIPLALQAVDAAAAEDIQERLQQALLLFFEIAPVRFFYYHPASDSLIGRFHGNPPDIDEIQLQLTSRAGLLAQCLLQQKITDSFGYLAGESQSVFDQEITALLGSEGQLCLPLVYRQKKVGVICAGINESQMPLLLAEMGRLEEFGRQVSAILGPRLEAEPGPGPSALATSDFIGAARKVVHEVNTPLSIIKNYLAVLSGKITDNSEAQDDIRLIREEIDRIPGIIGQLHRADQANRRLEEAFDVNETIDDLIRLLEKSVFKDTQIRLQFRPDRELPKFYGKKNHLLQVLTNLLKNSAEAMSAGGGIVIETQHLPAVGNEPERLRITVKDNGPGIPPEVMDNLFEPGNSTKGPEHFGLGLSICKDIVELYGGKITCSSSPGRGAAFRIHLPVYAART